MVMRNNKSLFGAFLGLLFLFCFLFVANISQRGEQPSKWMPSLKGPPAQPCPDKPDWLSGLDLTFPIRYAHRDIIVNPNASAERASITKIDQSLFPDFQTIDINDDLTNDLLHCKPRMTLDVPVALKDSEDASHLMFGISTTQLRLDNSLPQLVRWLPHTNARLIIIVIESEQTDHSVAVGGDPAKMAATQNRLRDMGIDATLVDPLSLQDSFSQKYFSLTKIMFDNRKDETQWIGVIDDDTFFTSLPALVSMLGKHPNPAIEQYYVGGLSEEWWSVAHYGLMGFGGAGIFISLALAHIMADNYQYCKDTSRSSAGDLRIMECIYDLTETKLTSERDLHQIDIHGDISGLFESGRLPLSLHHWKPGAATQSGYDLPMMHLVADICGECFLQRWQFGEDMVLANGYSISVYPQGDLQKEKFEWIEYTWSEVSTVDGSNNRGVDHSLGPTRSKLELNEQKIQYKLINSAPVEGGVRQSYLHRGIDGDIDSLVEIFWLRQDMMRVE